MPLFVPSRTNTPLLCKQHYTRQTLRPGKHVSTCGSCMGLTVAWLKKMQLGHPLLTLPKPMEGLLGHYRYRHESLKEEAPRNDWDLKQISETYQDIARSQSPADTLRDPQIASFCRLQGFQTALPLVHTGPEMHAFVVGNSWSKHRTATYLVCLSNHVIGLVIRNGEVALFDSNRGIFVFTSMEALDKSMLSSVLNKFLTDYGSPTFGVMELKY